MVSLMLMAGAACGYAQNVVQNLSISLTIYNQNNGIVRPVHISTRDVIRYFAGTNVPGGKLLLVMPASPSPDGSGNLGASLRVTGSDGTSIDISTPVSFNLFQTSSSGAGNRIYAFNQFSIDFGGFHAELYGTSTWTASPSGPGGQGSFHASVSGHCVVDGITSDDTPCQGSMSGSAPKPEP